MDKTINKNLYKPKFNKINPYNNFQKINPYYNFKKMMVEKFEHCLFVQPNQDLLKVP